MTAASTLSYGKLLLQVETATPGTYAAPCGFLQRSFKLTKSASETVIPDCADDDAAAWIDRDISSLSATITGQGVLDTAAFTGTWEPWSLLTTSKNCRMTLTGTGLGYYTGAWHLMGLEISGKRGDRVTISVEMASDGALSFTTT